MSESQRIREFFFIFCPGW